jgi:glutamate N-acetyltransferase/amino-acid N-acetyltransferase
MAKGAGMIQPNMATMLSYILTDAAIPAGELRKMLKTVLGRTFNRISVDSDTSTNDTVLLLANSASGVEVTKANRERFESALGNVAESLAVAIARDGEGARKLLTIAQRHGANAEGREQIERIFDEVEAEKHHHDVDADAFGAEFETAIGGHYAIEQHQRAIHASAE